MHNLPAQVWNKIAQTVPLRLKASASLMAMTQQQLDNELESQAQALRKSGNSSLVIAAYQQMMMPLAEQQAISAYISQTGESELRQALPDVQTAAEAVALATNDLPLTGPDRTQFLQLLTPLEQDS